MRFQNYAEPVPTIDPTGHFAYVANSVSTNVSAFTVDGSSAVLTPISGSPFATGSGMEIAGTTVDPSGKFLYVANFGSSDISAFSIGANGGLTSIPGSPFAVSSQPGSVQVDPSGAFAYVPALESDEVQEFAIGASGALTLVGTVRTRPQAAAIAFCNGATGVTYAAKFAYVPDTVSNDLSMYAVDSNTGGLTSLGTVGAAEPRSAAVNPSGTFAYAANQAANNVSIYKINGATGILTSVRTATAGTDPLSVAIDPSGRFASTASAGTAPLAIAFVSAIH